jgi:glycosyltransferase involved in cell wall biosynthesis
MIFSVVTPSFNCKDFILENIQSVRDQGFGPQELEQWVIDGGSTDGTVDILGSQRGIQWVSERDNGLSDAVNKGIQRAKGDWIIWLNADDLLAKDACQVFVQYVAKYPEVRLFAGDLIFLSADGTIEQTSPGWAYNFDDLLGPRAGINQPSTFVHREVYQKVGLIDVSIRYAMDYEWVVRAVQHYKCVHIPHVLSYSRRRKGSLSDAHLPAHFREFIRQRRKYGKSRFSRAELCMWFYIYTDWLRQVRFVRRGVRRIKRVFGKEPLHPM